VEAARRNQNRRKRNDLLAAAAHLLKQKRQVADPGIRLPSFRL
jgi:hypothetical protein